MFSHLRTSVKLSLLVGVLILGMLAVGAFGVFALARDQAANAATVQLNRELLNAVDAAASAELAFKSQIQQFNNVLVRGHDPQDFERYAKAFSDRTENISRHLDQVQRAMEALGLSPAPVDEARLLHAEIFQLHLDALGKFDVARPETSQQVDALVRGKDQILEEKIEGIVTAVESFAVKEGARVAENAAAESRRVLEVLGLLMVLTLVASVALGWAFVRSITIPIRSAVSVARAIAQGDLTVEFRSRGRDEVGQLQQALGEMTHNLRQLVGEVAAGARAVSDTSAQIAQGNLDLSGRTEQQATTLEETASSMEQLTATVGQNAQNARQASQLAMAASEVARKGGEAVDQVVSTMDRISDSSRRIADIIGVIDSIAFQTNILALNAAVEAARAGEQGRGFAVVAAEVRSLARRSASAAKEIKDLIADSAQKVQAGGSQVDAAGHTMIDVVASIGKVSVLIAEIAAASQEQSSGIAQVNAAVTQMDHVVQQNASLVEEASAATESMKDQARLLLERIARFKLHADQQAVETPKVAAEDPQVREHLPARHSTRSHDQSGYASRWPPTGSSFSDVQRFAPAIGLSLSARRACFVERGSDALS